MFIARRAPWAVLLPLLLLAALMPPVKAAAQQPGPSLDPTPFAQPKPFSEMKALSQDEPRQSILQLTRLCENRGFKVAEIKWSDGEFVAARKTGGDREDRVLVWLDRDPHDSGLLRVYLVYGRFEKFFGAGEFQRVKVGLGDTDSALNDLKSDVFQLSKERGL